MTAPDKSQAWRSERKKPPLRRNTFGWLYLIVAPTGIFAIMASHVRTYLGPDAKSGVVLNWASFLTLLVLLALSVPLTIIRRRNRDNKHSTREEPPRCRCEYNFSDRHNCVPPEPAIMG